MKIEHGTTIKVKIDGSVVAERNAKKYSIDSEAWATGKRDGTNVPSSDPTYQNNSKYYSEQAHQCALDAEQSALKSGFVHLYINDQGQLMMDRVNTPINFYLEDGKLYVTEDQI